MDDDRDAAASERRILERLQALASPVRLRLLNALVVPTRAPDIRVAASRERAGFEPQRLLSRSTVFEHLDVLERAGLVRKLGDAYAVDQQAMVALLQDMSELAKLRALIEVDVESTRAAARDEAELPPKPRLVVVGGPSAGAAFALEGAGPWELGRSRDCAIPLAHDPHVSRAHVVLARDADGFSARVEASAKNPASFDFARVGPGESGRLGPGSILVVGATTLVLQT